MPTPNSTDFPHPCTPSQALSFLLSFFFVSLLAIPYASSQTGDTSSPMASGERESLYAVIQSLVGSSWNGSDLFPDPCGWTPIQGISCDLFGDLWYVTAVNVGPFHDNSLECIDSAAISPHLFQLKHLKSVSFFSCFSSPSYPQTIPVKKWESLSESLEALEFRRNQRLVGGIPASFGCLKRLRSLVVSDNALEGAVPASLGSLAALNRLVLAGNRLNGQLPGAMGLLKELLILDLSSNRLSGEVPTTFGGLGSLLKLDLSSNSLSGKLPEQLGGMRNLTLLDLRNNSFSGGLPASFGEMGLLEGMLVGSNPLVDGCLDTVPWERLGSLVTLDISASRCVGTIPESLAELKKLRFLALSDNSFSGELPPKLAGLPSVSGMYLNGNNLSGALHFPQGFFQRMGRRLVVWGNPNLCYPSDLPKSSAPYGLPPCSGGGGEAIGSNYSMHLLGKTSNAATGTNSSVVLIS
ncbi:Piriformospora indica-insensitive protein 2 [Nymphaea thermarum]|nr:Piriformospora indica-insensitive protein 2 [Nymphaea thermarum]